MFKSSILAASECSRLPRETLRCLGLPGRVLGGIGRRGDEGDLRVFGGGVRGVEGGVNGGVSGV